MRKHAVTRATAIACSFVVGFALVLGLLWMLAPQARADGQATVPTLELDLTTVSGQERSRSGTISAVTAAVTEPVRVVEPPVRPQGQTQDVAVPRDRETPPDSMSSYGEGAPPDLTWMTGGTPAFAAGDHNASALSAYAPLLAPPVPGAADLVVCQDTHRVWGVVGAGETVTVTVNGTQMGAALADDHGFFWTTLYDANGDQPGLSDGDTVVIYHDGAQAANVTLGSIAGQIDVVSDVVSGTIGGVSLPISVTVYEGSGEPSMTSYSQTVSADGSGNFTADLTDIWDFVADNGVIVSYVQSGVEIHEHVYAVHFVVMRLPTMRVHGWTAPGLVVTATVYSDATTIRDQVIDTADVNTGRYELPLDFKEDDTIIVELTDGSVMSRTVDLLTLYVDPASDLLTGEALAGVVVRGIVNNLTPLGRRSVQVSTTVDATGVYTLDFGGVADIVPGQWVGAHVADGDGDDVARWRPSASVEVNQTWNEVHGRGPAPLGPSSDGRGVTLTLYSAISDTVVVYSAEMNWWSQYYFSESEDDLPDIAPGDIVTVEAEGYAWQGVVHVDEIVVQHDLEADRLTGTVVTPSDRVEIEGWQWGSWLYPVGGDFQTLASADDAFTVTLSGFDLRNRVDYRVDHRTADGYVDSVARMADHVRVWPQYGIIYAVFGPPGTAYTVTLRDSGGGIKAQTTGISPDPIGQIGWGVSDGSDQQIEPGDQVEAQSAAGFSQTVHILGGAIDFDRDNDVVSGSAPPNTLLYVDVDDQGRGFVPTDDSGAFAAGVGELQDFWGDGDIVWGTGGYVCVPDENVNQVCWNFWWPSVVAHYQTDGRSDVWGSSAIPGNTIYITVTHPTSGVVAAGTTYAGSIDWAWPYGYQLVLPDGTISPGNAVEVDFGDGFVYSTTVVPIAGVADADTDVVTITAPISSWVSMNADDPFDNRWESYWSYPDTQVGSGGYVTFDLSVDGFDVVYGTYFNIHIGDTQYTFWLPAPELWIQKETTPGVARPGGTVLYRIRYGNDGSGPADSTIISDVLPISTTYVSDTSGFAVDDGGSVITWTLGDVPDDAWHEFYVVLAVDAGVPTQTHLAANCVAIATASPGDFDPGNNESCSGQAWVDDGEQGLWVNKYVHPGDPHPGQLAFYGIDYGSDGSAATGPVWLTDTLPLSTTYVSWQETNGWGALWTEVVTTGGQFALYAPAGLPGDMGGRIWLTLRLDDDIPLGTRLENGIAITTAGDVDPWNNWDSSDAYAGGARYDMEADKWFNSGVLVPGGRIDYGVRVPCLSFRYLGLVKPITPRV